MIALFYPLWLLMGLTAAGTLTCSIRHVLREAGWVQHG